MPQTKYVSTKGAWKSLVGETFVPDFRSYASDWSDFTGVLAYPNGVAHDGSSFYGIITGTGIWQAGNGVGAVSSPMMPRAPFLGVVMPSSTVIGTWHVRNSEMFIAGHGVGRTIIDTRFYMEGTGDSSDIRLGLFHDVHAGFSNTSAYFWYSKAVSPNWKLRMNQEGTFTDVDTGIALTVQTWKKHRLIYTHATRVMDAYIDGVLRASVTFPVAKPLDNHYLSFFVDRKANANLYFYPAIDYLSIVHEMVRS